MLSGTGADTPLVTLVVPVYDVALYVGAFLDSLDAQALGPDDLADVQVVAVDDGSTDDSGSRVDAWAAASALDVVVVHQENRGLSGARNAGLELARGAWVSFPDPDDVLGPGYLAAVLARLRTLPDDVALLATRILVLDAAGTLSDTHRLRGRFANGSRVVDLDVEPDLVHLQAASGFYRLDVLRGAGLRFEADVRPNFEDAFLTAHHLAAAPAPKVALLAEAHYRYRRRADGSSLVQQSYRRPEKYTVLPRLGYLRLLQQFAARGPVPAWVQNLVLYDLLFYFREDQRENAATGDLPVELSEAFHASVAEILALVDPPVLAGFAVIPTSPTLREALRIGYVDPDAGPCQVHLARVDTDQRLVQLRYLHGTSAPHEELVVGGRVVAPVHAKTRDLRWFGRTLARERIAWVPATAPLELRLDGRRVPLPLGEPDTRLRVEPAQLWRELARRDAPTAGPRRPAPPAPQAETSPAAASSAPVAPAPAPAPAPGRTRSRAAALWQRARPGREVVAPVPAAPPGERPAAERFAGAWAFTDDDEAAGDNAEHLCRWVREHRPDVNAWFVLSRTSADWDRLEAEGFALVDPASPDFARLVRSTEHRIASRVDEQVVSPLAGRGRARGRFTYLPRRVLLGDESRTLDGRRVSLVVTTTAPEHASLVGDATPYLFTTKEVELAGMPRHDRLLALAATGVRPDLLLLAPATGSGPAAEPAPWPELASSPEVRAWAAARHLRLAVLAPGDLGRAFRAGGEALELLDPGSVDLQEVLAATAVLVTGSASLATEAAFLRRPVVHLQVEPLPAHGTPRAGWFRWEEHAFGPVCTTAAEAAGQLVALGEGERGPVAVEPWADRVERAFPYRDGRSCERVHARIAALVEPAPEALALAQTWVPTVLPDEVRTRSTTDTDEEETT